MELQRERSKFVCPLNVIDLLFPCFKYNSSVHFNFSVDTLSITTVTRNIEICCLSFNVIDPLFTCFKHNSSIQFNCDTLSL